MAIMTRQLTNSPFQSNSLSLHILMVVPFVVFNASMQLATFAISLLEMSTLYLRMTQVKTNGILSAFIDNDTS